MSTFALFSEGLILFPSGYALVNGDDLNENFGYVLPIQRNIRTQAQAIILASDLILTFNNSVPINITLPLAILRRGKPLRFVDAGLGFAANPITLTTSGSDTIVNWQTPNQLILNSNGQVATLNPFNDGNPANFGWYIG